MDTRGLLDLTLARLPGLSFRDRISLCRSLENEEDLARRSERELEAIIGRRPAKGWGIDIARMLGERDEQSARLRGIGWVSWHSSEYPPLLREIYDPPVVLFFRGSLPDARRPLVAVVGTRRPSPAASAQAFAVAKGLGQGGVSVVSGLALGIDAMAHRGSVEGGAPGFAVLGSGVDEVYPSSNRALARSILAGGGALISEYPPGAGPRKWNFPARNRIVSGISRGVLVVEAPEKSGALITAGFALEHNRDLWVASAGVAGSETGGGPVFDRRGTARLAEDGAEVVYSASDILGIWNMEPEAGSSADCKPAEEGRWAAASSMARSLGVTL